MTDTTPATARRTIRIQRRFDAPPEAVFRAWTDPVELAMWYGPDGWSAPAARTHIDGTPGGRWAVTMVRETDGYEFPIGYEILELDPPRRLVLRYIDASVDPADLAIVRVELVPDGAGTLLTLTDGAIPVDGSDQAEAGYGQSFEKLAARFSGRG